MVKVKRFSTWLEQRDKDIYLSARDAVYYEGRIGKWIYNKLGYAHKDNSAAELVNVSREVHDLRQKIGTWVTQERRAFFQATNVPDDPSMLNDLGEALNRMVGAMARRHGMFGYDNDDMPSKDRVEFEDAKLVTDYILGIKQGHVHTSVPNDVRWPGDDNEFAHPTVDDDAFNGGNANPDKIHGANFPATYPAGHKKTGAHPDAGNPNPNAGQPDPEMAHHNRTRQEQVARAAMQRRITNPSGLIHKMVQAFPRDLKLPSNWGELSGKLSTDYTAFYLPQVYIGNMRTMTQAAQMKNWISDQATKKRGDDASTATPAKPTAPPDPAAHYTNEARKWLTANGGATVANVPGPGGSGTVSLTLRQALRRLEAYGTRFESDGPTLGHAHKTKQQAEYDNIDALANAIADYIRKEVMVKINPHVALALAKIIDDEHAMDLKPGDPAGFWSPTTRSTGTPKGIADSAGNMKQSFVLAMS